MIARRRYCALLFLFAWVMLSLMACTRGGETTSAPGAEALIPVEVCQSSLSAHSVFLRYAQEKGIFEKHGLDVSLYAAEGGSLATKGLLSGSYDVCAISGPAVADAAVSGAELAMIGGVIDRLPYALVTKPEITTGEQLKGQSLAISDFGSSSDTAIRIAVENLNLDADEDVAILQIGGQSARLAALISGSVAGTVVSVPETSIAKEEGFTILLDLADTDIPYQHTSIVTRREVANEQPDLLLRFLSAVVEAMSRMQQDRDGTIAVLADYLLLDQEEDAAFLEEAYDVLVLKYYNPVPSVEGMAFLIELAKAENPQAEPISVDDLVDLRFIRELEETGFMEQVQR